jgi:hypothetical protein
MKKKLFFYAFMFLMPIALIAFCFLSYQAYKTVRLFHLQQSWIGKIHTGHPQLGYAYIPNARGSVIFQTGPDVPTWFDENGFRVPVDQGAASAQRPLIVALGCSFTFGYATPAEETFPYLVGEALHGTCRNAGMVGSGLCQMSLLAKKLLPALKPDYLLVQYSPWLIDRAQTPIGALNIGRIAMPYYYEEGSRFVIHPPVYPTKVFDFPFNRYINEQGKWKDGWSFFWKVSVPLSVYDDWNMIHYKIARGIGTTPKPTAARDRLITFAYNEINTIAQENGARMVIVVLGDDTTPVPVKEQWFPSNALVVHAHDSLLKRLPALGPANYLKEYAHWRGCPPVMVDQHPNQRAHRVIADAVVSAIRMSAGK